MIAMPLAEGGIHLRSERDFTAGIRRRKWGRRVAPRQRAAFQQLAQPIRTDLDAPLAWTPLRIRNDVPEGMTTTGETIRYRACGPSTTCTCAANWFEKLHDETAQTEANTEGNEHGTVDDVRALHTRSLHSGALRLLRG